MKGGLPNQQFTDAWYQARKKISDARSEFPEGVRGPYFNDEFNDVYMTLHAVTGEGLTMAELKASTRFQPNSQTPIPAPVK